MKGDVCMTYSQVTSRLTISVDAEAVPNLCYRETDCKNKYHWTVA